jgi:hypothetical protein
LKADFPLPSMMLAFLMMIDCENETVAKINSKRINLNIAK